MTDENLPRMTAQARYVAAILNGLNADDVATLVADPPGNRAKEMTCAQIAIMVDQHATDADRDRWTELLIAATAVKRKDGWSSTWATQIAKLLGICVDAPRDAPVPAKAKGRVEPVQQHSNGQLASV